MDRFWSKVDKNGANGCWLWIASCNEKGYGKFSFKGKPERAHRVAYLLANGTIPDGAVICHKCDTPGCVNPGHLFPGTKKDNTHDMLAKGRQRGQFQGGQLDKRSNGGKWNAAKAECPQGHPYSGDNLVVYQGRRNCRECIRVRAQKARARRLCAG